MPANYCTISDTNVNALSQPSGAGRPIAVASTIVPLFVNGTLWNPVANAQVQTVIANDGTWTVNLPYTSICSPNTVQFQIILPDGTAWTGTVPSVAGPLTLHDLKVTYSWAFSTTAPVSAIGGVTGPAGPAGATGPTGPTGPSGSSGITNADGTVTVAGTVVSLATSHANTWAAAQSAPTLDKGGAEYNAGAAGYGIDMTGAVDSTTPMQALLDLVGAAGGGIVKIPAGTIKITAALALNYAGTAVQIKGIGRTKSIISQATSNIPVITTGATFVWGVALEDLQLTYATPQIASHTGAIALQFGGVGNGASWYHWSLKRLLIRNAQTAMGYGSGTGLSVWNCEFNDILMSAISSQLINFQGTVGSPFNIFRNIKASNGNTPTGTTWAINLESMEAVFEGLGLEDWASSLFNSYGGSPVEVRGVHVERWTASSGAQAFQVADGPLIVSGATFSGTINTGFTASSLFSAVNAASSIEASHVVNLLTITNPAPYFQTVKALGGKVFVRDINEGGATAHPFTDSGSWPYIVQQDGFLPQGAIGRLAVSELAADVTLAGPTSMTTAFTSASFTPTGTHVLVTVECVSIVPSGGINTFAQIICNSITKTLGGPIVASGQGPWPRGSALFSVTAGVAITAILQVQQASSSWNCRPSSNPTYEYCRITITDVV